MSTMAVKSNAAWLVHVLGIRHNPLRRPVDRITGTITALLLAVAFMAVPAIVPFSALLHDGLTQHAARTAAINHPVTAVLTTDAVSNLATNGGGQNDQGEAVVQWTSVSGPHTATINVPSGSLHGQTVTVWTDQSGELTTAPADPTSISVTTGFLSLVALLVALGGCAGLIMAVQRTAQRYAQRAWAREWEAMQNSGSWLQR
jgi:hypothetical protein